MRRRAFGMALRSLRLQAGYSQDQLAGFSRTYISAMESGQHDPRLTTLERVAESLHISFIALISEIDRKYEYLKMKSSVAHVHLIEMDVEDDILLVTLGGTAEFSACLRLHREVLDCAQRQQIRKVLLDCHDVDGDVPAQEQYRIATEVVAYADARKIDLKLAMVGRPPTVDGYVSKGIREHGGDSQVFDSVKEARKWLSAP